MTTLQFRNNTVDSLRILITDTCGWCEILLRKSFFFSICVVLTLSACHKIQYIQYSVILDWVIKGCTSIYHSQVKNIPLPIVIWTHEYGVGIPKIYILVSFHKSVCLPCSYFNHAVTSQSMLLNQFSPLHSFFTVLGHMKTEITYGISH